MMTDRQTDRQKNNMDKGLQIVLYLFVFMTCVLSLEWTNVPVQLGQHALLNCSLDKNDVFWNMQQLGEAPVLILRTFRKTLEDVQYFNKTLKDRFSVKLGNRLFLHNVTLEDFRFYYCTAEQTDTSSLNEIFHLVSAGEVPNKEFQQDVCSWTRVSVTAVSLCVNFILTSVITGFYLSTRCRSRHSDPDRDLSPIIPDSPGNPAPAEYEEIQSSTVQFQTSHHGGAVESQLPPGASGLGSECIYYKAQMPVPTTVL